MSKFFIRGNKTSGTANLYFRVVKRKPPINILLNSFIEVDVAAWNRAQSSADATARYYAKEPGKSVYLKKQEVETAVENLINQGIYDAEAMRNAIEEIRFRDERERERKKAEEERRKKAEADALRRKNIWRYLDSFVNGMKDGTRLNGNDRYSLQTCKAWGSFRKLYGRFDPEHVHTWDDIDRDFVVKFMAFLESGNYMLKSINKYLTTLRALVGYAYKDGLHENDRSMLFFSKRKVEDDDKAAEIYLTEAELQALYEMPLTGLKEQVRDIFLVGCFTCQRVSDYTSITEDCFVTTPKGTPIIRLIQQKTRTEVKIPIINDQLRSICEKYNYRLPSIVDVIINRYIKSILKELSETVPSLAEKVKTRLTMKQRAKVDAGEFEVELDNAGNVILPRYACVTTHTARRSGITNMYLSHRYSMLQMMHVSGHKTEKTFRDYIKLSSDEIADEIDAIASSADGLF